MQRVCFVLQVKQGRIAEYKNRHLEVWPEMQQALRETGWGNYSIFIREDGLLVGYLETENFESARRKMAEHGVNVRWQQEMAPFFDKVGSLTPDQAMKPLEEVFHLDSDAKEP